MSTANVHGGRDWTQVPVHPAANIFPLMDTEESALLRADIQRNGQREPIVLFEGQVLDGRNRLRECNSLGIEPFTCEIDGDQDPFAYVLSANLARRHLSKSQAAAIAAEHLPNFVAEAEVRKSIGQKSGGRGNKKTIGNQLPEVSEPAGKAVEKAAAAFGVSPEYIRQAAKVMEASPESHEQVKAGELSVKAAAKRLATKETTIHAEHWKCLECGATDLHLNGYCEPCWSKMPPEQQEEFGEANLPDWRTDASGARLKPNVQHALHAARSFRDIVQKIGRITADIEALAEHPFAGVILAERLNSIRIDLKNAQRAVKFCAPHQVCPYCGGKGCEPQGTSKAPCRGTGWTIRGVKGPGI